MLDTHALIWWVDGNPKLSEKAREAIDGELASENGLVLVSSITAWEIALLVKKQRLTLSMNVDDWLEAVQEIEGIRFVPVDNAVAIQSTRLPGDFHPDPADRLIVSLARHESVAVVTTDERITAYRHVKTIW